MTNKSHVQPAPLESTGVPVPHADRKVPPQSPVGRRPLINLGTAETVVHHFQQYAMCKPFAK